MPHRSVSSEIEAKLLAPEERTLRAIARVRQLGLYRLRKRRSVRLHSLYLDTAEMALARHGVALRVRRAGRRWEATAKWSGRVEGFMHDRPELNVDLPAPPQMPFALPEGPLRVELAALVAGRTLQPILLTDIDRRETDVWKSTQPGDAPPAAELAIDRVHLRTFGGEGAEESYFEVEIELKSGAAADVAHLAELLQRRFPLTPSSESKFSRGLALLHQRETLKPQAPAPVGSDDSVAMATRKIVGRLLRQLRAHDPGTRRGEDPEELHDMRVATRRLRAGVKLLEAGFPQHLLSSLRQDLRWLGNLLGGVRDMDVQLGWLDEYEPNAADGSVSRLAGFRAYLEAQRESKRAALIPGLDSERYARLLRKLENFATSPHHGSNGTEKVARVGRRAIRQAFRRVEKCGNRIGKSPEPEELHAVRIRAKRLRYLLEFLREITGKPGRRLVKDLTRLQDLLGAYHDAVVAENWIRQYLRRQARREGAEGCAALKTLAEEQQRRAERSRSAFRKAWQRFVGDPTLKDLRAVLEQLEASKTRAGVQRPQ